MAFIAEEYAAGSEKALEEICERVLIRLKEEHHADLMDPKIVYTTDIVFREELAAYLGRNPGHQVELASLEKYSAVNDESDDGEKAGNIVPTHEFGERFKLNVKNDDDTEDDDA